jgi:hypothetical protein
MDRLFSHPTRQGMVFIARNPKDLRFHILWSDELLGNYPSADQAAEDLGAGHSFRTEGQVDLGGLGISRHLADWYSHRWIE